MQGRDPPPHVAMDYAPKSQGWANDDPNLPRQPKYQGNPKPVPIERERERPQPPTPSYAQDYRNNGPGPRSQDRGRPDYPSQMPPKLDTRMDVDPRDLVNTRHALSPRSARNQRGRMDDIDSLPEGPRSARPLQERQERPYHAPAPPVAPPLNPRYENVPPSGFQPPPPPPPPPPRRSGYQGERFNDNRDTRDNRSGWRDNQRDKQRENQPRVGYPDRNNPPPRRDFRGRPDDGGRPPAVSGANTMPIGSRKVPPPDVPTGPPSLPPNGFPMPPPAAFGFNPDARPPSSTLINPVKAQALELNTRIPNRPAFDQPRSAHPPESAKLAAPPALPDQQLTINTETEKSKRRVSRFSPLIPKVNEQQERIVQPPSNAVAAEELDRGHATPPPISRNSSTISFKEHGSAQPSVHGRSSSSPRTPPPVPSDRHEERSFSSRFSDEVSREDLSRRMSSTRDTLSPTSPRMAGSEQGADLPASLSRRMIGEKPPRHRKYSSQFKVPEDLVQAEVTIATEYVQVVQDNSLKDRLDSANSQRRGSLLDRLSLGNDNAHSAADSSDVQPQSLRDRLVPSKRDRDDMMEANDQGPAYDAEDGNDNKRVKRRATKGKRGGRR
ncbi:hypothetical protein BDN70DRAFT_240597 [Pholiota conissans]|uniref:Uncharacterized protein n=1 Tax=Pholiota conissans TaxID=109636 RepID=A0A9P6D800_9AGAR|nr:hypothetical protein BDN70DRAFT_240597 [Pholiota conissans]